MDVVESVCDLTLGLLRVSREVGGGAAAIFYGRNIFNVTAEGLDYSELFAWFVQIGKLNRCRLACLRIKLRRVECMWQFPDGSRVLYGDSPLITEELAQRNYRLVPKDESAPWQQGKVDCIDPRIEKIFELLGGDGSKACELQLLLDPNGTVCFSWWPTGPETPFETDVWDWDQYSWVSQDLTNLIETWRDMHTSGGRKIDVQWHFVDWDQDPIALFNELGFDVLHAKEHFAEPDYDFRKAPWALALRKRPLVGPLVASSLDPSPDVRVPATLVEKYPVHDWERFDRPMGSRGRRRWGI